MTLTLSAPWKQAHLETILCKFGRNRVICIPYTRSDLRKTFTDRRTDGQTDDGRRAIVLAHGMS